MSEEKNFLWVTPEDVKLSDEKFAEAQKNYECEKYLNAVAYANAALRLNPNNAKKIKFLLGLAHLELGTLSSEWDLNDTIVACDYFRQVIKLDPTCAEAYFYCGVAVMRHGNNWNYAIDCFNKNLELAPDNESARKNIEECKALLKAWKNFNAEDLLD